MLRTALPALGALALPYLLRPAPSSRAEDMGRAYRDAERLPSPVKLKQSEAALAEMQSVLSGALRRLQEAHESKDIKLANCVKGNLAKVKGFLRISEEAGVSLREAVVMGQVDLINHEFVKISMALERVKLSQTQISGCAGNADDAALIQSQQTSKSEVSDKAVEAFTADTDEQSVIIYQPISAERPEAITVSQ
ncbi:MAG: hypothetical protein FJ138_11265 [Deltaproteobacteria bacterium]|nr:hypothetical protein [Deltaproteobacteria bacterium]